MNKQKFRLALGFMGVFLLLPLQAQIPQPVACDRVRILPAPNHEKELVGARISGSIQSDKTGMVVLAEITKAPEPGQWLELAIKNPKPYRWLRYDAPEGTRDWISKLEFYAGDQKLKGDYFSCWPDNWRTVVDDRPNKGSAGVNSSGQYFGIDIGDKGSCTKPGISPGGSDFSGSVTVTLQTKMPGASIRYTTDGTLPTLENGKLYAKPFAIDHTCVVDAVTFADGYAPSPVSDFLYFFKTNSPKRTSLNLGNSLTGNAVGRFDGFLRSAGCVHECKTFGMGGATTRTLWNAAFLSNVDPKDTEQWKNLFTTTHSMYGESSYSPGDVNNGRKSWENLWSSLTDCDDVTFQPRDANVSDEVGYTIRWLKFIREKFPNVQPWLYVEWHDFTTLWGGKNETREAIKSSFQMQKLFPSLSREESMAEMMLYGEEVQHELLKQYPEGKKARILPVALAFGWIFHQIENGQFPELAANEYFKLMHSDKAHATAEGSYLIDAVWFAAMYGQSPEGKLLPLRTALTPAQALSMQRLAWDIVKNYPDCGLYEKGRAPAAKAEFSIKPGPVTANERLSLTSATPGAWFRYTLDGTEPTRTRGYIYCGVITICPGMIVKTVAYKSGMADSLVATAVY